MRLPDRRRARPSGLARGRATLAASALAAAVGLTGCSGSPAPSLAPAGAASQAATAPASSPAPTGASSRSAIASADAPTPTPALPGATAAPSPTPTPVPTPPPPATLAVYDCGSFGMDGAYTKGRGKVGSAKIAAGLLSGVDPVAYVLYMLPPNSLSPSAESRTFALAPRGWRCGTVPGDDSSGVVISRGSAPSRASLTVLSEYYFSGFQDSPSSWGQTCSASPELRALILAFPEWPTAAQVDACKSAKATAVKLANDLHLVVRSWTTGDGHTMALAMPALAKKSDTYVQYATQGMLMGGFEWFSCQAPISRAACVLSRRIYYKPSLLTSVAVH